MDLMDPAAHASHAAHMTDEDHHAMMDAAKETMNAEEIAAVDAAHHAGTSGHSDHHMEHDMHGEMDHDMHREREHHGERRHRDGRDRMDRAMHMRHREESYLCNSALDIFHTLVARKDEMDDAREKAERAGMILTELAHGIG